MNTQSPATALSGHLYVSNHDDNLFNHRLEFPFSGSNNELWKFAAQKFQESYAQGWNPVMTFKSPKGYQNLQMRIEDIDMILSM